MSETVQDVALMGMSVYEEGNPASVDNAGDGDSPVADDDDIIWNDAKAFSDANSWSDWNFVF